MSTNALSHKYEVLQFLKEYMTPEGYEVANILIGDAPDIWDRKVSGSGKYHKRPNGYVPTVGEHVLAMLKTFVKTARMWGVDKLPAKDGDWRLIAIAFHDVMKYGEDGKAEKTLKGHESTGGTWLVNQEAANKYFNSTELYKANVAIRWHMGRWSSYGDNYNNTFLPPFVSFVHALDMLETNNCLTASFDMVGVE